MIGIALRLLIVAGVAGTALAYRGLGRRLGESSGWERLLQAFPDRAEDARLIIRHAPGRIASVTIGRGMEFHVCNTGLRIYASEVLKPLATPIFVPWDDIAAGTEIVNERAMSRLALGRPEIAALTIENALWDRLRAEAGVTIDG